MRGVRGVLRDPVRHETTLFGLLKDPLPLQVTDVNVAVLVIFAITSMGIYGIVIAVGSNSKHRCSGPAIVRADDQYELSYGRRWPR